MPLRDQMMNLQIWNCTACREELSIELESVEKTWWQINHCANQCVINAVTTFYVVWSSDSKKKKTLKRKLDDDDYEEMKNSEAVVSEEDLNDSQKESSKKQKKKKQKVDSETENLSPDSAKKTNLSSGDDKEDEEGKNLPCKFYS